MEADYVKQPVKKKKIEKLKNIRLKLNYGKDAGKDKAKWQKEKSV